MEKIILLGGGGHCISCIDVIEQTGKYEIAGIIDVKEMVGRSILGYPVIGTDTDIETYVKQGYYFLITVGQIKSADIRIRLYKKLISFGATMPVIISPHAYVSKHAEVGQGSIIMHHSIINAGTKIGYCNIINSKSLLEHEVETGDFCHISTAAVVNGQVKIGNNCFIGSQSVINNNINITNEVIIASASRISKDIKKSGTYINNKPIK